MLAAAEEVDVKQDVSFLKKYREGMSVSVSDRRITKATMEKYGVVRCDDGLYFPYHDKDNQLVAAKVRSTKEKSFSTACSPLVGAISPLWKVSLMHWLHIK
jgi:hypothetical protein